MNVVDGVRQLTFGILTVVGVQLLVIFVHHLWDHIKVQALCGLGLQEHEVGQRFRRGIGQPFVDGDTVAFGFRNLFAVRIEEQLIHHVVRLFRAEDFRDAVIDVGVGGVVLPIHLKIDAQRSPACAKVRLPLEFHVAARDRQCPLFACLVVKGDRVVFAVHFLHRHVENAACFRVDRKEDRIGRLTFVAQRGQHHFHDVVVFIDSAFQDFVELARFVELSCRIELVLEPKGIEETAQHRVVVVAEGFEFTERIGHRGQRLLLVVFEHVLIGDVGRNLAHPVKVVRETDQTGRDVRNLVECVADHRGPQNFAKGADMRQTRWAVACLKQNVSLFRRRLFIAFE